MSSLGNGLAQPLQTFAMGRFFVPQIGQTSVSSKVAVRNPIDSECVPPARFRYAAINAIIARINKPGLKKPKIKLMIPIPKQMVPVVLPIVFLFLKYQNSISI